MEVLYLTLEEVLVLYADLMAISPHRTGEYLRDPGLLESALNRAPNAMQYEEADIVRQAATLLWGIVRNHPFVDGNKRVAHLVAVTFLRLNGYSLSAILNDAFTFLLDVAQGLPLDDVEAWLRIRVTNRLP